MVRVGRKHLTADLFGTFQVAGPVKASGFLKNVVFGGFFELPGVHRANPYRLELPPANVELRTEPAMHYALLLRDRLVAARTARGRGHGDRATRSGSPALQLSHR